MGYSPDDHSGAPLVQSLATLHIHAKKSTRSVKPESAMTVKIENKSSIHSFISLLITRLSLSSIKLIKAALSNDSSWGDFID